MFYVPLSRKFEYDESGSLRANVHQSTAPLIIVNWRGTFVGSGSPQEIFLDGENGIRVQIPAHSVILFDGNAVCIKNDYTKILTFSLRFSAYRNGSGNTTLRKIHELLDDEATAEAPADFGAFSVCPDRSATESNNQIHLTVLNPDTYLWKITGTITQLML